MKFYALGMALLLASCGPNHHSAYTYSDRTSFALAESTLLAVQVLQANEERQPGYQIEIALAGTWDHYHGHDLQLEWESFSLKGIQQVNLDIPADQLNWSYPQPAKSYLDLSNVKMEVAEHHSLLSFFISQRDLQFNPNDFAEANGKLTLTFPTMNVLPTEPELTRIYHKVGHWNPVDVPYKSDAKGELLSTSAFQPTVDLRLSLLETSGFTLELKTLDRLERDLDEIWGRSCGIRMRFSDVQTVGSQTFFRPIALPITLAPEILQFMDFLKGSPGLPVVSGTLLSWPDQLSANQAHQLRPSGMALRFARSSLKSYKKIRSRLKTSNQLILIENLNPLTLAHEIGHIILEQGHDPEPESLMYALLNGENEIKPDQCRRARKFLSQHSDF